MRSTSVNDIKSAELRRQLKGYRDTSAMISRLGDESELKSSLMDEKYAVDESIARLRDPVLMRIVYLRFIEGFSAERTAEETNYSPRQVIRLTNKAIQIMTA